MTFTSEEQLGKVMLEHLQSEHWDCYQEVQIRQGGPVADIVALCGQLVMVVELKRSLSLAVIAQADHWRRRGHAHLICVAVPTARSSSARGFAKELCVERGIGVFELNHHGLVRQRHGPRIHRHANVADLRAALHSQQKQAANAGTANGGHMTPFRRTLWALDNYVRDNPGTSMKAAFAGISHHYASEASARAQIRILVDRGVITSLRVEKVARGPRRGLYLYPAEVQTA